MHGAFYYKSLIFQRVSLKLLYEMAQCKKIPVDFKVSFTSYGYIGDFINFTIQNTYTYLCTYAKIWLIILHCHGGVTVDY